MEPLKRNDIKGFIPLIQVCADKTENLRYVNYNQITDFSIQAEKTTIYFIHPEAYITVRETLDEVLSLIEANQNY